MPFDGSLTPTGATPCKADSGKGMASTPKTSVSKKISDN
ncbi:hypothetical protein FLCU109888_08055 [Flavobacterium cucumis]|uniref:Uncharacterized protein n=1 Tax=Flavobacterium cucumis TaxID=416016 RepID=A0A1M7ZWY4_9FLAO|nr:hypothetical protein SAMN05443547_1468 [Flavobacterium cucumis]